MSQADRFAPMPEPPYYAVIFSSTLKSADGYGAMAERMVELALTQPGCLGVESTRDAAGYGITVSYWRDEESIAQWRQNAEHREARRLGRERWYEHFTLRVARVERAYDA